MDLKKLTIVKKSIPPNQCESDEHLGIRNYAMISFFRHFRIRKFALVKILSGQLFLSPSNYL